MASSTQASGRGERLARGVTVTVTLSAKVVGIVIALNETLIEPVIRASAMAAAMVFFAGAEAAERAALRLLERMIAQGEEEAKP